MTKTQSKIVLVTGYSGAGMSSVLKAMEDQGYEVFDNFPLALVDQLLTDVTQNDHPIAIGIDTRTRGFAAQAVLDTAKTLQAELFFIACQKEELQRRFTETRRRHPLAKDRPVRVGIEQEIELLRDVYIAADQVIDTTGTSVHDLRHMVEERVQGIGGRSLTVTVLSFGFKHGVPREADIVMDVRFVKNPHWDEALRPLTGKDKKIGDFIENDDHYVRWLEGFQSMIEALLPRYVNEGKNYLTIAIGCTGGRHRSVYSVEKLHAWLKALDIDASLKPYKEHRDLGE